VLRGALPGGGAGDAADGDPFDTSALRSRVIAAWAASPARFREDANAEEDLALGAYRDRVVVELAQNAADAATRAGVPGRLLLRLDPPAKDGAEAGESHGALVAANTGAPLDAAGVEALSTLRASAKREVSGAAAVAVGRFGVGFAAVLALSDDPSMCSRSGGVRWSRSAAGDLAGELPTLAGELSRRTDGGSVLRLPFPAPELTGGTSADGNDYDTVVRLPLRSAAARALAARLLAEVDAALLLALPALVEVTVDVAGDIRTLRAARARPTGTAALDDDVEEDLRIQDGPVTTRWRLRSTGGRLDAALLVDRPTEERERDTWTLTWAIPVDDAGRPQGLPKTTPAVVHAPTPTAEPLSLPALLIASLPLDPGRRHVAAGPLRDFLISRAAHAYAELVAALPPDPSVLDLVPGPLAAGELDAEIGEAVRRQLAATPLLPAADAPGERLRPQDAVVVPGLGGAARPAGLARVLPALIAPDWAGRPALRALGVRETALAEVVDALAALRLPATGWRELYDSLDGADQEELGTLPVPLSDGRLVRGPRGLLLPGPGVDPTALAPLGLRLVDPAAVHPLLERLGAMPATPHTVLHDPAVRAAVVASYDVAVGGPDAVDQGGGGVADAVLSLVAAAGVQPGEAPWLADLALPADDGEPYPAGELLLPDGPLAEVVSADAPFGVVAGELVRRWGPAVLEAAGVLASFALLREEDVPLDPEAADHDLDGEAEWMADVLAGLPPAEVPPVLTELVAVRDLELVDAQRWPRALAELASPELRAAVTEPALVLLPSGERAQVTSYAAWWLRHHPVLAGQRPSALRLPRSDPLLIGLYDDAPLDADRGWLAGLGCRDTLSGLLAEAAGPRDLLARLADPARVVGRDQLRGLLRALARVDPDRVHPPDVLRAVLGRDVVVVDAGSVVVVDAPDLLPVLADRPVVAAPSEDAAALADLLALPLGSEVVAGAVSAPGEERAVPGAVAQVLPGAPATYRHHERLRVDAVEVAWRYVDGVVHAADAAGTAGLARGLAWAAGAWEHRHVVETMLREPGRVAALDDEAWFDG